MVHSSLLTTHTGWPRKRSWPGKPCALLGSHMAVEDAEAAQFGTEIPPFAKPTFERFRRARHAAQYFDPSAARLTASDATWAIGKAKEALSGSEGAAGIPLSAEERFG